MSLLHGVHLSNGGHLLNSHELKQDGADRTITTEAGYRQYQERDLHTLKFIRSARDLGFSLEQIRQLLSLWYDGERSSAEVKQLAESHLSDLDERIQALITMRDALVRLSESCCGDDRPDCPILEGLAGHGPPDVF